MFELTNETLIRALLFVISFFVVFITTNRFFKDKVIPGVLGLSISALVSFFITNEQLNALFSVMGSTGIIVLIGIPFIVAFFFIYHSKILSLLRKLFWIFYGIASIFILNGSEVISLETKTTLTIILAIFFVLLLFLDSYIKKKFLERANLRMRN